MYGRVAHARPFVALIAAVGIATLVGCGSSGKPASTSSGGSPSTGAVKTSDCGTKPGVKATGTPIALGTIVTDQPGVKFTDIP